MSLIFKYFKKSIPLFIICFFMLFVQAMSNLYLPNYMANIMDTGIQRNGINENSPKAVTEKDFNFINEYILLGEDSNIFRENYKQIKVNSDEAKNYINTYPVLDKENIFIKKELNEEQNKQNDAVFGKISASILYILEVQGFLTPDNFVDDGGNSTFSGIKGFNMLISLFNDNDVRSKLYEGKDKIANIDPTTLQTVTPSVILSIYADLGLDATKIRSDYIFENGIFMMILSLVTAVSAVIVSYTAAKIASRTGFSIRKDLFEHIQTFSQKEFNKFSISTLINRTTNDINQVQDIIVIAIRLIIYSPIMAIGGIYLALSQNVSMSCVIFAGIAVLMLTLVIIFSITVPKFKLIQKCMDKIGRIVRENLSGIMVIRAFRTQKHEKKRFDEENKKFMSLNKFVNSTMVIIMPFMTFIMNLVCLIIVWVGANELLKFNIGIGNMIAFIQYTMIVMMSFLMLSVVFAFLPRVSVTSKRISEVMATEPTIKDVNNPQEIKRSKSNVLTFENVYLKYPQSETYALSDINFEAKSGETVAFIGSTGSGKSSLVKLIPRFIDATEGSVKINGLDIRNSSKHDLRSNIGFTPQKCVIFSGTIKSNLLFGNENASDEDIRNACDTAHALDFIESKKEGFNYEISRGGTNVSGGQRQRLCIARSIVRDAMIYIFDDSFSALDFKTDRMIRTKLKKRLKNSITLIVAQRISTIMDADKIVVLDKGKIVGIGTHSQLMEKCENYINIAKSQLTEEDRKNVTQKK